VLAYLVAQPFVERGRTAKGDFAFLTLGVGPGQEVVGHVVACEIVAEGIGCLRRGAGVFFVAAGRGFLLCGGFGGFVVAVFLQGGVFEQFVLYAFFEFRHGQFEQAYDLKLLRRQCLRLRKLL